MTTSHLLVFLGLVLLTLQQQEDLLKNFCRIFGHQTAVIDRKLYIDGGFVNYNPLNQYPKNETNTGLFYGDFDVDNEGMPRVYDNLTKPADAPDVNGGIMWPDTVNKMLYLYGGEFSQGAPSKFSMWVYDALYNTWTTANPDSTQANIQRASYGSGVALQDRAVGFYYGGWLSHASVPTWKSPPMALSSLLEYDMLQNTWMNSSGPDSVGRAEGAMVYIPASEGMLVYFGGIQTPGNNGTSIAQPMDTILLYDVSGSKWYTQKATGQVPANRRRFCAGATWAQDYSSYNVYLYGGLPVSGGPGFDDIYILSMPSFSVMGGTYPNSTDCDVPKIFAMHNMYLGKQNPEGAKWAKFRPNLTEYKVPSEVISVIGGSATGGATTREPARGFASRDLEVYFERIYKAPQRSPTRTIPTSTSPPSGEASSESTPVGAIVGGVIGGIAGVSLVAAILFFYLRRRPSTSVSTEEPQDEQQPQDTKDPGVTGQDEYAGREFRSSELDSSVLVELEAPISPIKSSPSTSVPDNIISPASPQRGPAASPYYLE
ncbi:hypothetical protein BBP40_007888 [Aspergillus hancockii]|nr:hypothetical protein BBP40_007888 [Aspergillus hancockii]